MTANPPATALHVAAYAAPIAGGPGAGLDADRPVTPASVAKIQVALAVVHDIAAGRLDGREQRVLSPARRTPGPTGISLARDEVRMSIRDLVTQMLTISDNVATDELIALAGLDRINALTASLGLPVTHLAADLRTMLDEMAAEVGHADYAAMNAEPPDDLGDLRRRLHGSAALDPARGSRTTAAETVRLLRAVWADPAAAPVREAMAQQLTRHRLAAGFPPGVAVAAKSGGLMGLVRNEAGVVTYPDGGAYAVAVFTRTTPDDTTDPAGIDAGIGRTAHALVSALRRAG